MRQMAFGITAPRVLKLPENLLATLPWRLSSKSTPFGRVLPTTPLQ